MTKHCDEKEYLIQGKNGTKTEWKTLSNTRDLKTAEQRCLQVMKQRRGNVSAGTKWYKTRVAVIENGRTVKVGRNP